jgi:hypothetical protein
MVSEQEPQALLRLKPADNNNLLLSLPSPLLVPPAAAWQTYLPQVQRTWQAFTVNAMVSVCPGRQAAGVVLARRGATAPQKPPCLHAHIHTRAPPHHPPAHPANPRCECSPQPQVTCIKNGVDTDEVEWVPRPKKQEY